MAPNSMPRTVLLTWQQLLSQETRARLIRSEADVWSQLTRDFERTLLQTSLEMCRGRRVEAASRLGMGRNTITRKMRELGIEQPICEDVPVEP